MPVRSSNRVAYAVEPFEATRVRHAPWRGGCVMATGGASATAGHAGDWVLAHSLPRSVYATFGRVPPGPKTIGLRRGSECGDRVSLGEQRNRSAARVGGRFGPPSGGLDRSGGRPPFSARSKGCHLHGAGLRDFC